MTDELVKGNELLENLRQLEMSNFRILRLDGRLLFELYAIEHPAEPLHTVIRAVLLILSVPERVTEKWDDCRVYIKYFTSYSILKKIEKLKIFKVHPSIMLRADEMISSINLEGIKGVRGVAALFSWLKQILIVYKNVYRDQMKKYKAATVEDQLKFFPPK